MIRIIFSVLVFTSLLSKTYSQEKVHSEYLIITYEIDRNKDQHGVKIFYWIIPTDSLLNYKPLMSPIYFSGFTNDHFKDCMGGTATSIFTISKGMDLGSLDTYKPEIENLVKTIRDHRRHIQTITKKWANRSKETIKVFITPIKGEFCNCKIGKDDGDRLGYQGDIYLPVNGFSFSDGFWKSEKAGSKFLNDLTRISFRTNPFE